MAIDRRRFLLGTLATTGAAALGSGFTSRLFAQASGCSLPSPSTSGIEHVVVIMMENRSFDHLFGWLPGADGKQAGLTYYDSAGVAHSTYALAPDYTGCGHPDPDHSYNGGRVEYDNGAMDGFLRAGNNDIYSIGYYGSADQPFLSALAQNYTTSDRYFPSILGPTFPNRIFAHAAQTDRLSNTAQLSTLPTIWDRLAQAGVSGLYYFSNLPFLGLWGPKYATISRPYTDFLASAALGTLPAVSFIDPWFTTIDDGTGTDDHPHANIQRGDAFLAQTFQAVASGPAWANTVLIIDFDEWGGFFDHVVPPRAIAPNNVDPDLVHHKALLGIRVPAIVASPWSRGNPSSPRVVGSAAGMVFDHTSILKLIEWRWSLEPLTARDASNDIDNLACALDFSAYDATVPDLPQPPLPAPVPCLSDPSGIFG